MKKIIVFIVLFGDISQLSQAQQDSLLYYTLHNSILHKADTLSYSKYIFHNDSLIEHTYFIRTEKKVLQVKQAQKKKKNRKSKREKDSAQNNIPVKLKKINSKWQEVFNEKVVFLGDALLRIETTDEFFTDTIYRKYLKHQGIYEFQDLDHQGRMFRKGMTHTLYPLRLEGKVKYYNRFGRLILTTYYKNNQILKCISWHEDGRREERNVHPITHIMPCFKGGKRQLGMFLAKKTEFHYQPVKKEYRAWLR